jgi:preprotein translocase subunit SecA
MATPPPQAAKIADALARDVHYTVDEKQKNVLLTEDGYEAVEDVLQVGGWGARVCVCGGSYWRACSAEGRSGGQRMLRML